MKDGIVDIDYSYPQHHLYKYMLETGSGELMVDLCISTVAQFL